MILIIFSEEYKLWNSSYELTSVEIKFAFNYEPIVWAEIKLVWTGSWRRKLKIALFGELSLEEAMDLSRDRQILDLVTVYSDHM
jgi:hypothetical protein